MLFIIFFFFSSRRRHTRCGRDWSSDVCSSDLFEVQVRAGAEGEGGAQAPEAGARPRDQAAPEDRHQRLRDEEGPRAPLRSEERRVGKECRTRRWADDEKKKKNKNHERGRKSSK